MKKINVVGVSGSGKSFFSKELAEKLDASYLEMDAIFWKPNWEESKDDEFFANLSAAISIDSWVLDGNYNRTRSVKWKDVDTVVWIDYSFPRTVFQAIKRALTRVMSRKEIWAGTGNKESLKKLFSKHSIVLWTLKNYYKVRRRYEADLASSEYAHIRFVRIQNHRQAREFLASVDVSQSGSTVSKPDFESKQI
ncbi:P-loop NTPase family protein [Veronia nyctiphanis]|uniref:adenylate kinase n=1 Tax=Veronia nyctiphanis TaxID=1278244 RepID=UPI00191C671D|nr:adenylate kinase [Veronia nyctiphanis]